MYSFIIDTMPHVVNVFLYDITKQKIVTNIAINDISIYDNKLMFNTLLNRIINKSYPLDYSKVKYVAYRILFGGENNQEPVLLSDNDVNKLEDLIMYSPMHMPATIATIRIFKKFLNNLSHIGFFETSFFQELPTEQKYYAVPFELAKKNKIKKYGFHSIFHEYSLDLVNNKDAKILSLFIDKKITLCAINNSKPIAISFGFTPLEGIMGETSSGDIDTGILFYIMKKENLSVAELDNILKYKSGFFGLTGQKKSIIELYKSYNKSNPATFAFDLIRYQLIIYIGKYYALLNGITDIVIGGEYAKDLFPLLYNILKKLFYIGINLNPITDLKNIEPIIKISSSASKVNVFLNNKTFVEIIGDKLGKL